MGPKRRDSRWKVEIEGAVKVAGKMTYRRKVFFSVFVAVLYLFAAKFDVLITINFGLYLPG